MKNKGFTLVEVMAIVIIIAAIALVSFPVLTNVVKNNEKIEEDTFKENAIEAAKTYCNLNKNYDEDGNCSVSVNKLIEESYLDKTIDENYDYKKHVVECYGGKCSYNVVYHIGEELTLKNEKYNIIGIGSDYVTLLKQQPLTVTEVNKYGTALHVNAYVTSDRRSSYYHKAYDLNGYGGMAYYSSSNCGVVGNYKYTSGCNGNYEDSEIKYVVDAWAQNKFSVGDLKNVNNYSARLIQFSELQQFFPNCTLESMSRDEWCDGESATPSWLYANHEYWYWTMSQSNDYPSYVGTVWSEDIGYITVNRTYKGTVRPVINVYKSALENNN